MNLPLQPVKQQAKKKTHRGRKLPRALRRARQNAIPGATGRAPGDSPGSVAVGTPTAAKATLGPPVSASDGNPQTSPQVKTPGADGEAAQAGGNATVGQSGEPKAAPGGTGGAVETALFSRPEEIRTDAKLTRRARREGWEPDPRITQLAITRVGMMAAETKGPDGKALSAIQLIAAGDFLRKVEQMNQAEQHHQDRMDYYERAMQVRAKIGEYQPPGVNVNIAGGVGGGDTSVSIYLPSREDEDDEHVEALVVRE